ncbi:energy-coupling factor transporter transmembrane component T family protein [Roseibium sp.]|uniref:energy-coupling factor transporter transmembrane component T family protein n=1 Tax=Roseibium sp. TaxID=1936156 RepID=UPI003A9709D2
MISLYLPGTSWLHRCPVRVKLLLLALAGMAVLPITDPLALMAVLAVVLGLYASLGKEGLGQVKALKPMLSLLVIIFALHAVTGDWMTGVTAVLRLLAMVLAANLVSITSRMDDMLEAVRPLFVPLEFFGVSARKPALAVSLVIRFAPVLLSVYASLREAYQARTGKRTSWRLMAPFLLQSLSMSENVAEALTARGGAEGLIRKA